MKISIKLLLLIIVALFEHNSTFHFNSGIVYNGQIFDAKKYPYVMYLRFMTSRTSYSECTGSLVKKMFVLTAAHCCFNKKESRVQVFQGSPLVKGAIHYTVYKMYIHQHYDDNKTIACADICILKLNKPYPTIKKFIKIGGSPKDFKGGKQLNCSMFGFGRTGDKSRIGNSGYMMTNGVVHGETACKLYKSKEMKAQWREYLCLIPNGVSTVCNGDSGGPMICNGKQYGVCSFGFVYKGDTNNCGDPNQQEVYSFIHFHLKWINNIIEPKKKKKKKKKNSGNLLKLDHIIIVHTSLTLLLYNVLICF